MAENDLPFKAVCDLVFRIPGITSGFIQRQESLDEHRAHPEPGAPGVWAIGHKRISQFRVYLRHKDQFAEVKNPSLKAALNECLVECHVSLEKKIAEAREAKASSDARGKGDDDSAAYAETIMQLLSLKQWLGV